LEAWKSFLKGCYSKENVEMKSLAEILAMFPTATLLALHPSSLATGESLAADAATKTESGVATPSAAVTASAAGAATGVTLPTPSTTKTWEIVSGRPGLFVIDVPAETTFCSYFTFTDQTNTPPYRVRRATENTTGHIGDDTGGSSVAHGALGGYSPQRSTHNTARIFIYQIDLLVDTVTTPREYTFYVELRP
jgi:hypothetical protein